MNNFKCLLVGCGKIAGLNDPSNLSFHAPAIFSTKGLSICGAYDINHDNLFNFCSTYRCQPFTDIAKAILDCKPDIVSICTSDDTHYSLIKQILSFKSSVKVIFVEKPVCISLSELDDLSLIADTTNIPIVVNHSRRFNRNYQELCGIIRDGTLGQLVKARLSYYGGWIHNGIHLVDTFRYLLKEDILWISINRLESVIYSSKGYTFGINGISKTSHADVTIFPADENHYQLFEFDLFFENGRVRVQDFNSIFKVQRKTTNNYGENILGPPIHLPVKQATSEMQNAYFVLCQYLDSLDPSILSCYSFLATIKSMRSLFEGDLLFKGS